MRSRPVAILQTLVAVFCSALVTVLAKNALGEIRPLTFVWLQVALGGTMLTAWTFGVRRRALPRLTPAEWIGVAVLGLCNYTIARTAFIFALDLMPATTNAYLINFVGVVTMVASAIFLREVPSVLQIVGALLAIGGLRVFFREVPPPEHVAGILWIALGVAALAASNIISRRVATGARKEVPRDVLATLAVWIGGAPIVAAGAVIAPPAADMSAASWGVVAANGLVSIALWLVVWFHVLRTLRSYEASVLAGSAVIWVALLAVPLLGERLAAHQWVGIAAMLGGLVLVQSTRPASAATCSGDSGRRHGRGSR